MKQVGQVKALWRYPVKSMRGEQLSRIFIGSSGVQGDRTYAFHYSGAATNFPYLTARQQPQMLLYRSSFHQASANSEWRVLVETPAGDRLHITDTRLIELLSEGIKVGESVSLLSSEKGMPDAYPVSLLSLQTVAQLSEELGLALDKLRFRANLYLDLENAQGFAEDEFVGRKLLVGSTAVVEIIERDDRCKMITLDPDTGQASPDVIRQVARVHEGKVGVYASVSVQGFVDAGDPVLLLA